ncbi:MAG TPA: hypothetical protein VGM67_04480 [Gemmatimonadaceae bacterium]|jgi:YbbR domain-containing protein
MDGSPALRASASLQRRLIAAFTQRLALKGTAVFLAIVLWLVVNDKQPQSELVGVQFQPVLLDSSLVLRDPPPEFKAIVVGSPKELIKLTSTPPVIRRQIDADAPDTLVVDLRPEDVVLPEGVDAVVSDVQPRSLTLRFEPTWTRRVPVLSSDIEVVAEPGSGYIKPQFDPPTVQISGPRHLILKMPSVRTMKTTIGFPDSLPHLVDIDTSALGPGVRVRPSQVKVHLLSSPEP